MKDPVALHRALHSQAAIQSRLRAGPDHSYLRDFVYGAVDGTVTTFAVVSGVAGAGLSTGIIVVLGLANLLGDGFSMAAGNFLGTRAERAQLDKARQTEELHISLYPEGEREEVRQIFIQKGFSGDDLEKVVDVITSDSQQWVNTMLREELGLRTDLPSPGRAAAATFAAFVLAGTIPLLPFAGEYLDLTLPLNTYTWSAGLTAVTFFVVGAGKAKFVQQSWIWSGLETLLVGGLAAAVAYAVGTFFRGLV